MLNEGTNQLTRLAALYSVITQERSFTETLVDYEIEEKLYEYYKTKYRNMLFDIMKTSMCGMLVPNYLHITDFHRFEIVETINYTSKNVFNEERQSNTSSKRENRTKQRNAK